MKWWRNIFLTSRFYWITIGIIVVFLVSYALGPLAFFMSKAALFLLGAGVIIDYISLYSRNGIIADRLLPKRFSNGDNNQIFISIQNKYAFAASLVIIDELPFQFQARDNQWEMTLSSKNDTTIKYELRPTKRGEYVFGNLNLLCSTPLGLIQRRFQFAREATIPTFPSFLQMRKYELAAFSYKLNNMGVKRIRRLGNTMEFEQIKEYVLGDDPRNINWKATARRNELMINQYVDEKSQEMFCIIDKGRLMKSPFDGLSLLDYAINASLVLSNIGIKKEDKAGLVTFGHKLSSYLPASKRSDQILKIQEILYNQKTKYLDANYELLSTYLSRKLTQRSLLFLFTNFETFNSFKRQLPYFQLLSRKHLLIIVFFRNTGIEELINSDPDTIDETYSQIMAEKHEYEKELIVRELKKHGIHAILTTPKNLSIDSINRYLEMKALGLF